MKNIVRASLVALMLVGAYAGLSTPAPAMSNPRNAITVADGGTYTPTSPTSPTKPGSGGVNN
ncbi:MAG TPA: hypothetical protein VL382_04020 [Terriglobales bacterium]|nr:hypothetical protein [Terriglobales bacterium]